MKNNDVIKEKDIKEECGLSTTFTKGKRLYNDNAIYDMVMTVTGKDSVMVSAIAEGSYDNEYELSFELSVHHESATIEQYSCQCEAFKSYSGICKHIVAAMLEFNYQLEDDEIEVMLEGADEGDEYYLVPDDRDWWNDEDELGQSDLPEAFFEHMKNVAANTRLPLQEVKTASGRTFSNVKQEMPTSKPLMDAMSVMMLKERNRFCMEHTDGDVELEVTLNLEYDSEKLELRVGRKQMYVVKNIQNLVKNIKNQEFVKYGKNLEFVHTQSAFSKNAQFLIQLLMNVKFPEPYNYYGYYRQTDGVRTLTLDADCLDSILSLYEGRKLYVVTPLGYGKEFIPVIRENPRLPLVLEGQNEGKHARIQFPEILLLEGVRQLYIYWNSCIYICSEEYCENMREMLKLMSVNWTREERGYHRYSGKNQQIQQLGRKDYISFCSTLLPLLEKYMDVKIRSIDFSNYQVDEGSYELHLDMERNQNVICMATAKYGDKEHNLIHPAQLTETYRDVRNEYELRTLLNQYFPEKTPDGQGYLLSGDDDRLASLVRDGIGQLENLAEVYVSDAFKQVKLAKNVNLVTGLSIKGNLLNVSWDLEGMSQGELMKVLDSYKRKKKYYRLKNGELLSLADSGLETLAELQEDLQLTKAQLKAGMADVPLYRALYMDAVMRENADRIRVTRDKQFEELTNRFDEIKNKKYELPKAIHAELRPYQEEGYQWASLLAEMGFGGILADDMGLGKTLQMITYMCSNVEGTHLVVCPASLVYNWEAEINKFAPVMKVCTMAGTAAQRQALIEHYEEYDVVITSYDLLKRDIEYYTGKAFACQIIDEAQYIKNPSTQAAKAVKTIESRIRFALTGTPIENRLSELWSIFEYLMPGYLYSYKHFKECFEENIVQGSGKNEKTALTRLHTMIRPFLLRRLKKDVLAELLDKMEEVVYSKLSGEQEKLYKAAEKQIIMSLRNQSQEQFKESKLQILAELTKLRQICCDPSLLYENYNSGSSKLDTCMDMIESAIEGGHRILLFSQFTSMLDILAKRLEKSQIRYFMLTGSTSKVKRRSLVERFQDKQAEVFLISLKAGGTGLNLTAADMVIHYDPWWNVAAQNQATDRTHRIGQMNVVTVMKLIARNTIEERILALQEKKKELADMIISEEGVNLSSMSREDLLGLFE